MTTFVRFPHTAHVTWLGDGRPRDDKVMSSCELGSLLDGDVIVEEKVDGANIGLSTTEEGELRAQNRGGYLDRASGHPQFGPLWPWLSVHGDRLLDALWPDLILFGEWCYSVHSIHYDRLPDWFLGFDVYDRESGRFWNSTQRNELLTRTSLCPAPLVAEGRFSLERLRGLLGASRLGSGPMEGVVVRKEEAGWTVGRGKLVRAEFAQAIGEHWSRGPLRRNELAQGAIAWR